MARTDAALAALAATVVVLTGCGSNGHAPPGDASPPKPQAPKAHHLTGPTHPGGNTTKGE